MSATPSSPSSADKPTHHISDFEFLHDPKDKNARLGTGSFATVKLAQEKSTGNLIALKMVNLENSKNRAADLQNLRIETNIHGRLNHQNIIQYYGFAREENSVYIILEYASKGNLYVYSQKKQTLTQREIFRYFFQTTLAIQYLHKKDVMHRDIKPENLLLDQDMNIKLCDFGWSTERIKEKRTTFCGTYEYMAPEIVHKRPYDYRVDIWSLGILLYELIHKEAPYKGRSLSEIFKSLSKGQILYSSSIDPEAKDLIHRILKLLPEDRLSISQIIAHPWVQKQLDKDPELTSMYRQSFKCDKPLDLEITLESPLLGRKSSAKPVPSTEALKIKTRQRSEDTRKVMFPLEELSSESSCFNQTKSSTSICKAIVERFESEEDVITISSPRKKNGGSKHISDNLKKTLNSGKPYTFFDIPQESTENSKNNCASVGFITTPNSAGLFNTYSIASGATGRSIGMIGPFTPTTSFRNPNTLTNLPTPTSIDRNGPVSAPFFAETTTNATLSKRLPMLIASHKQSPSLQLGSNSAVFRTVDNTSSQIPLYKKTRAVVDETEGVRKTPPTNVAASTRSIYHSSKPSLNLKQIETSSPAIDQPKGLISNGTTRNVTSPLGLPKRDFFRRTNSDMPKIESFIKENGLASPTNKVETMVRKPPANAGTKQKAEKKESGANAGPGVKITREDFNRTVLIKSKEQSGNSVRIVRPLMKGKSESNKEEKVEKLKLNLGMGVTGAFEKNITPRSYNFRIISN